MGHHQKPREPYRRAGVAHCGAGVWEDPEEDRSERGWRRRNNVAAAPSTNEHTMKLYNTMGRRLEEFTPAGDEVKIYVCGITPYDRAHLGHAVSYIIFDVVRRYLEFLGFRVKHVQNYTDI